MYDLLNRRKSHTKLFEGVSLISLLQGDPIANAMVFVDHEYETWKSIIWHNIDADTMELELKNISVGLKSAESESPSPLIS